MRVTLGDVGFNVNGRTLVSGISLAVGPGSITALIGPNGAGKTTLIRLLAGDAPPTSGAIDYDGEHLARIPIRRRARLRSVLPQSHTSDTSFTVEQVVSMGRYAYRLDKNGDFSKDEALVTEAIESLDLAELRTRQIRFLSGGERQRVAIARVLAQQAPLVLLDEPTTALDIRHKESVIALIEGLRPLEHTVMAVLHDLNMATHFDQVMLLDEGRIVSSGSPSEVLTGEVLSAVYGHPIDVVRHPTRPGVLVLPRNATAATPDSSE